MPRKTPRRRLIDTCTKYLLFKKIAEALDSSSSDSDSSILEDDPITETLREYLHIVRIERVQTTAITVEKATYYRLYGELSPLAKALHQNS